MKSTGPGRLTHDIHGEDHVLNRYTREGVFEANDGIVYWVLNRHAIALSSPFTASTLIELTMEPIATGVSLGFTQFHWWEAMADSDSAEDIVRCGCTHQVVMKFTVGIAELCQHYLRWDPGCMYCPAPNKVCNWQLNGCDTEVLFDFDDNPAFVRSQCDNWHVGAPVAVRGVQPYEVHAPNVWNKRGPSWP